MTKNTSNDSFKAIAMTLIVALGALSGYLLYDRSNQKQVIKSQAIEIDERSEFYDELDLKFTEAKAELDNFKSDNAELNKLIETQKADLDNQRSRINRLARENKDLNQAKEELANLSSRVGAYLSQIDDLKYQNQALVNTNFILEEDKKTLTTAFEEEKTKSQELTLVKTSLMSDKEELTKERNNLNAKVDMASVIHVRDIVTQGYKIKGSGKLKKKGRASAVKLLQVCFRADKNLVAQQGSEKFYVQIINPLGETLSIESLGSGVVEIGDGREQVKYTTYTEVDYTNEEVPLCVQWKPDLDFKSGNYQVNVFNKGYQVGQGHYKLK